jgi:hypothetical protein
MVWRQSGEWMVGADERILESLLIEDEATPTELSELDVIHRSRPNINQRLQVLEDHDLVKTYHRGVYELTPEGVLYLLGEYDAQNGQYLIDGEDADKLLSGSIDKFIMNSSFMKKAMQADIQ